MKENSSIPGAAAVETGDDALPVLTPTTPCPYLPGLSSRSEAYLMDELGGDLYTWLMSLGFRRSGHIVYRPRCQSCNECRPLRVPAERFVPSRSMRRVWRRNVDVTMDVGEPEATEEKHGLFCRYLDDQHDDTMSRSFEAYLDFLYRSPMDTLEYRYRLGDQLVGVSICDRCPDGLSSVYMYFDPTQRKRSLGTLSVLREIQWCKLQGLPFYYMGYYVAGSKTMAYKARFRPNETLISEGRWATFEE